MTVFRTPHERGINVTCTDFDTSNDLTELLNSLSTSGPEAHDELFRAVYYELRRRADGKMRRQPRDHTLTPTALVHDVYAKLFRPEDVRWKNRRHFFAVAALAMRSILVDHARKRRRKLEGLGRERAGLDDLIDVFQQRFGTPHSDIIDLHTALEELKEIDCLAYEVVNARVFLFMSMKEIAEELGTPLRTVERAWAFARAWLLDRLS